MSSGIGRAGFTLIEAVITVAVAATLALILGQALRYLSASQWRSEAEASLQDDADLLTQTFSVALQRAGDGVPNCGLAANGKGKTIFAVYASSNNPEITFFHRDSGAVPGRMDAADEWLRYRLLGERVLEERYRTDASTKIAPGNLASRKELPLSPGARITKLEFDYYNSNCTTPNGDVNCRPQLVIDGYAASHVRVHLEISKNGATAAKDAWIRLRNVINARQIPSGPC